MRQAKHSGFTLIELMIAIVVLAILLAVAVPSFRTIIQNNRRTTTVNSLLTALQLARTEAVKRSESIDVCASTDGSTCAGSTDWSGGWLVYSDPDNNGLSASPDCSDLSQDCVLRVASQVESGITVTGSSATLTYLPSGLLDSASTISFDVTIDDCNDSSRMRARQIQISLTGLPNVDEKACS